MHEVQNSLSYHRSMGDCEVGSQGEVDEGVTFKMPPELRID